MKILENFKLRTLLLGLSTFLLVSMMLVGGVGLSKMAAIGDELKGLAEEDIPLSDEINDIESNYMNQLIMLEKILRTGESRATNSKAAQHFDHAVKEFVASGEKVNSAFHKAEKIASEAAHLAGTARERQQMEEFGKALKELDHEHAQVEKHIQEVTAWLQKGKLHEAHEISEKIEKESEDVEKHIDALAVKIKKFTAEAAQQAEHDEQSGLRLIAMVAGSSLVLGIIFSLLMLKTILGQLGCDPSDLNRIVAQVANGQLNVDFARISHMRHGVFGSVWQMTEKLQHIVSEICMAAQNVSSGSEQLAASSCFASVEIRQFHLLVKLYMMAANRRN
ncbi:MAG: Tar ligand binding domain-containing protein, partial [Magnetococcus sp. DMHC-1]